MKEQRESQTRQRESLIDMHIDREKSFTTTEKSLGNSKQDRDIVEINPSIAAKSLASPNKLSPVMSPSQKLIHMVGSPVRLVRRQVEPGSVNQSTFSLIIICMGAGTITIPYVFYKNGLILGTFFVILGGALSLYTGYLISYCAQKTGGSSFEEISYHLYGSKGMRFTAFCNNCCNIGFLISYIVLVSFPIMIDLTFSMSFSSKNLHPTSLVRLE